ncbi:YqcI/YcgG family protein [Alkalihalobacillus deserti]|uniref:YqcI/YcgG family protein n=1 Tax=Alkalihalobacillus deserti TaxID=2879466 RepID=UPI001D1334E3|nr:YqcI/YcgG family protein [Alkalihalobacillus deserti]
MTLFSLDQIETVPLTTWKTDAVYQFKNKMTDTENAFPCIPAIQALYNKHLRFAFVGDPRDQTTSLTLADTIKEYALSSRKFGKYSTLITFFFTPNDLATMPIAYFEHLFWEQLKAIHAIDQKKWPSSVPKEVSNPAWEFCFHGEPLFIYCASPAHKQRKSRNFPYFMFALTPRWVLQNFPSSSDYANIIKSKIRNRLTKYDSIAPHPDLNTYGNEDNFEWKQYFLRDDQTSSSCPFLNALKKEK